MKAILSLVLACGLLTSLYGQRRPAPDTVQTECGPLVVQPVRHASVVLSWGDQAFYVDPVGRLKSFAGLPQPTSILITHAHYDHFKPRFLESLPTQQVTLVMPKAVAADLPDDLAVGDRIALNNGEEATLGAFTVEAIPMYNLPDSTDGYHPKGWGNGYVISGCGTRVYVSGDTEDVPAMRALQDIDVAFVSMNLPFTMSVVQAADAVLDFAPGMVYPYHFKGLWGLSDLSEFRELVLEKNEAIEVRIRDWYQ